jgi:hypothetical protein
LGVYLSWFPMDSHEAIDLVHMPSLQIINIAKGCLASCQTASEIDISPARMNIAQRLKGEDLSLLC